MIGDRPRCFLWEKLRLSGSLRSAFLGLAVCLVTPFASADVRYEGTNRYGPIPANFLERAVTREPVIALFEGQKGNVATFFGREVTGLDQSAALMGVSADALFMACLTGQLVFQEQVLEPGELFIWLPGERQPKSHVFDARRFRDSAFIENERILASLDQLIAAQEKDIFWGLLQPTPMNAQSSTPAAVEFGRRVYLNYPKIVQLRFAAADPEDLPHMVMQAFAQAVGQGDVETAAALISPDWFTEEGEVGISPQAIAARFDFAQRLVNAFQGVKAEIEPTSNPMEWLMDGYEVHLQLGDGFLFVSPKTFTQKIPLKTRKGA